MHGTLVRIAQPCFGKHRSSKRCRERPVRLQPVDLVELVGPQPAHRVVLTRTRGDAQMTIQALFDNGGQKMIFCPYLNVPAGEKITCTQSVARKVPSASRA